MERRDLGLTGIQLPVIGVGARASFDVFGKEGQSARRSLVDEALAESANFFETSPDSGDADGILASSLTGRRQRAIVATSLRPGDSRLVHAKIDRILRLFEERLDILLVEGPSAWPDFQPVFRQMKSDGTLRVAGVTCSDASEFPALAQLMRVGDLDVIQIPYNPATPQAMREILPLAASMGTGVIVVQPFESGLLLDVAAANFLTSPLRRLGVRSIPEAILKWILSDPRVASVVVGTRRQRHLLENLRAGNPPWMGQPQRSAMVEHYRMYPVDLRY